MMSSSRAQEHGLAFTDHCGDRWDAIARDSSGPLDAAADMMMDVAFYDLEDDAGRDGLAWRQKAFAGPLGVLEAAGEEAVPILGVFQVTGGWAGPLASETLAKMPTGPWRDRALVEALFITSDWQNATATRAWWEDADVARTWPIL